MKQQMSPTNRASRACSNLKACEHTQVWERDTITGRGPLKRGMHPADKGRGWMGHRAAEERALKKMHHGSSASKASGHRCTEEGSSPSTVPTYLR